MKRILSVAIVIVMLLSLAACGKDKSGSETQVSFNDVSNINGSVDVNEDSVKLLLGAFTAKQLGLKDTIEFYDLTLSAYEKDGKTMCKVEAFAEGAKSAEGTFLVDGATCYVYNAKKKDYVLLTTGNVGATKAPATGPTIPVDPEISMQHHHGNNESMHKLFSKYELSQLGLSKDVKDLVFIVPGNTLKALDGSNVYIVEVYEKNGTKLPVRLGFSEKAEYIFSNKKSGFVKLKVKTETTATPSTTTPSTTKPPSTTKAAQ